MKTFAFCLLLPLGCFLNSLSAQSDSLITELEKTLQIQIDSLGEEHLDVAMLCDSLGKAYLDTYKYKKYEKAIKFHKKALKIRLEVLGEKHPDVAKSYGNLGQAQRNGKKAIRSHKKALKIRLEILGKRHADVAESYDNLGQAQRNGKKAIRFHKKALKIRLEVLGEKHLDVAKSYDRIGQFYDRKRFNHESPFYGRTGPFYGRIRNHKKAIRFHNKALKIRLEVLGEKHLDVAKSYFDLGHMCKRLGDNEKAISFYKKALIGLEVFGEEYDYGINLCYMNITNMYINTEQYDEAKEYYEKLLNLKHEYPSSTARYHNELSKVYQALGNEEAAEYYIEKAKNINYYSDSYGRIRRSLKNDLYFTLPEKQLAEHLNRINKKHNEYYSYAITAMKTDAVQNAVNLLLNAKGITLDHSISTRSLIQRIDDTELRDLEKELRKINKNIANVEMMSLKERVNHPDGLIEIFPMYEYRDSIIGEIGANEKLQKSTNRPFIEWQEVQSKLKQNEVSIDFVRFNHSIDTVSTHQFGAAIISKDLPNPQFISLGNEEAILSLLQINDKGQPEYLQNKLYRKELYEKIWQPLLPYLKGIKTIHISPAGLLHKISFEALQDEQRQYLGEQFQFHYYSSMRDFIKKEPTNQSYKNAVIMGDILYDTEDISEYQTEEWYTMRNNRDKVRRLEATLEEVTEINNICSNSTIKSTLLTIDKATEDTIQYFSGEHAPSILHLATHGLFLEPINVSITGGTVEERLRSLTNPLQRSVLMLYGANHRWEKNEHAIGTDEDGILTALEVTALDLRKTDLVVLSACSTALGEVQHNTEGVFGLQRAFKLAGVNHVVASLWDVDDKATKDLMVAFYGNLLRKKQTPATALRNAKDELREDGYEPDDWAGFILIE